MASTSTTQREIPPGLADLLEGFVLTVIKEKPVNLVEFAAQYFGRIQNRKNSLVDHGVTLESLPIDFFHIGSQWDGEI